MMIRHEPPDPAFSYRVQAALLVQTGPEAFLEVRDWSPEGFTAPDGWPEDGGGGTLTIPFQGIFLSFNIDLPPAAPGDFVPFSGLDGRAQELLRQFHQAILTGRMASVDGLIRSIDRPVDLVPMTQTEEDGGRVPAPPRRRLGRTLRMVAIYGAVGMLLWTALWSHAWDKLTTLPLQSGRYESFDAGTARATGSGWIDHRHAIQVYVGMDATLSVNVGGEILDLPAVVVDVRADREPEGRAKSGYIVGVVADAAVLGAHRGLPAPAEIGGPAEIRLHAPFLPRAERLAESRDAVLALAGRVLPARGTPDAD
jgi:hypothetical protein